MSNIAMYYEILKICHTAHLTINYFDKEFMLEINYPTPDKAHTASHKAKPFISIVQTQQIQQLY